MAVFLTKGTIEYLTAAIEDTTQTYTTLEGGVATNVKFDVRDDADVLIVTDQAATPAGMTIRCLVDTTPAEFIADANYKLYPKFTIGAEDVVLGPLEFFLVQ